MLIFHFFYPNKVTIKYLPELPWGVQFWRRVWVGGCCWGCRGTWTSDCKDRPKSMKKYPRNRLEPRIWFQI